MVEILTAKLVQHPKLVKGIDERGGLAYIQNSTHIVKGDAYWESTGQNKFIQALADAYRAVKNTNDLPIQYRYNIPNANAVQKELKLPSTSEVLAVARNFKMIIGDVQMEDAYGGIVKPYLSKKTADLVNTYFKGGFQHWAGKSPEHIAQHVKLSKELNESMLNDYIKYLQDNGWKKGLEPYTGEIPSDAYSVPTNQNTSSQQSNTSQQPKTEAKITDAEVEAMTDALVEMYPEIEFGVESNPNFVDKEGVFNQRIENTNQNVDAEVLDKINSFELYEDKETLCPGGICNFTARKSTEHLIEVGLNPYPNTYNGSQLPVQVDSPMGPFKITHFVSAVAINDSVYIYDMPQNEFISDDFFGMGSDVKVKQAYKPRLIFLSLDDIQSNYNLSVEDAGNFIHSILNNRGWEGANAAPSFKEYISKNINNSEIYIKSLEDEISKSGYKMPEYFNREAYEKEVQDKRNNIINETLSKEDKDKVLNYYANKLRIKTREYLPTKTDSFSLRELVKSVIGDIEVNIDKSSFQNALASLKEFLNSKDFIDRLLHVYEFSGTNLKNAESSISDVYSTG